MDRPYEDAVAKGIALLDEKKPGWRDKVDIAKLNMMSCFNCILGQVFEDFPTGVDQLSLTFTNASLPQHGFTISVGYDFLGKKEMLDFYELKKEWILQLSHKP